MTSSEHNKDQNFFSMATKTTKQRVRAKRWVFTLNNYTPEEENKLKEMDCEWMVFGHEHTKEGEGTPHLQGALTFKKMM